MDEYHYTDGQGHTICVDAASETEAHEALSEIVERDWPDTTLDDWQDE